MKKVNNKKGFTLAELLVVLAILAVLVAIAVPLFTGAIGDANQKVIDANIRSIKSAALVQIMNDPTLGSTGPWYATCTVDEKGTMGPVTVSKSGSDNTASITKPADNYSVKIEAVELNTGT